MASTTGKRKRTETVAPSKNKKVVVSNGHTAHASSVQKRPRQNDAEPMLAVNIQVVTGSYERALHGFIARFSPTSFERNSSRQAEHSVQDPSFSDTFLFAAHSSSIRCLALSPPTEADKRLLATGSTDERINLYSVSTIPPSKGSQPSLPTLAGSTVITENPRNRSLGSLVHHDRAISGLYFASKSKLFSAAEDNTIAISRTRDWTMLSSIKAPIPKAQGRPSGDTAAPGETPAGINDFAVHPSQKLMISVGKGERCMRLWNLMTGRKAGVLNLDRHVLAQAGETKFSSGEGRKVAWNRAGEFYVIGFERGAVVFGIDSMPKAVIRPSPPTKIHQLRFIPLQDEDDVLVVSTEDGRLLFFDINSLQDDVDATKLPQCPCLALLGGQSAGISGRIKDFDAVLLDANLGYILITANSDGAVRFWHLTPDELGKSKKTDVSAQIGTLLGTFETGDRITCMGAFIMDGSSNGDVESEGEDVADNVESLESE